MKHLNREHRVQCPQCGAKFYTPLAFDKHVRTQHVAQQWRQLVKRGVRAGVFKEV